MSTATPNTSATSPASHPIHLTRPPFCSNYSHLRDLKTGLIIIGKRGEDKYLTTLYQEGIQLHPESRTATVIVRADGRHYRDVFQMEMF